MDTLEPLPLIAALLGALAITGCDRQPQPETDKVAQTGSPATPARPPAPIDDPSLPPAKPALDGQGAASAPAAPAARDAASTAPMADLDKREQSQSMPKPNQANNHSSTALDRGQSGR